MAELTREVRQAAPWVERAGRLGLLAKSAVYLLVGALAVMAALGLGGDVTDKQGALQHLRRGPAGDALLGVLAVGLFAHALWRFVQAARDPEHSERGKKSLARRIGYAAIGVIYASLGVTAVRLMLGEGGGRSSDSTTRSWTGRALEQPFGRWIVALVAVGVLAAAVVQWVRAKRAKFVRRLELSSLRPAAQRAVVRLGRFGIASRGVVLAIVGGFLLSAALRAQPQRARGLRGALVSLLEQPHGQVLLGVVAAGLCAYGLYALAQARYRRIVVR